MTSTPPSQPDSHSRNRWTWAAVSGLLLIAVAGLVWYSQQPEPLPAGVTAEEFEAARAQFRDLYRREPDRSDALMLLGEQAAQAEEFEKAVNCFAAIPSEHPTFGMSARLQQGQLLAGELFRVEPARSVLLEYLQLATERSDKVENVIAARDWLRYMYSVELRFVERKRFLEESEALGIASVEDLKLLYFPHLLIWNLDTAREPLRKYLAEDPQNPQLRLAHGRYLTGEGRVEEALEVLETLHQERPDDLYAWGALLECYHEQNDWEAIERSAQSLPPFAESEHWLLTYMRALLASHQGQLELAVKYFEHVLEFDPTHPACTMRLARALDALNETDKAQRTLNKSVILADIRVNLVNVKQQDPSSLEWVAERCYELDFPQAAAAFRRSATRGPSNSGPP